MRGSPFPCAFTLGISAENPERTTTIAALPGSLLGLGGGGLGNPAGNTADCACARLHNAPEHVKGEGKAPRHGIGNGRPCRANLRAFQAPLNDEGLRDFDELLPQGLGLKPQIEHVTPKIDITDANDLDLGRLKYE